MRLTLAVSVVLVCASVMWAQQQAPIVPASSATSAATIGASSTAAAAQADPMRADVKRLLEVSGTEARLRGLMSELFASQIASMKRLRPDIPVEFWDEFQIRFVQQFRPDELIDLVIPIYEKHFTSDDIKQMTEFYESPVGRKYVSESVAMQAESMAAGREWGRNLGQKIAFKVEDEMRGRGISHGTPPKPPIPDSLK